MKQTVNLPLAEIRRYANNPRNNERTVNRLAASIKDFGFKNPKSSTRTKPSFVAIPDIWLR